MATVVSRSKRLPWKKLTDPTEVRRLITQQLRLGATAEAVRRFALRQRMEVSELADNVVYASAPARSGHPLIEAQWLVQFRFKGGELRAVRVERGLTGP
jgi:hypothetical protein